MYLMHDSAKETLLRKICDRSAVVGVVGLGYVGLPFAVEKAKVGFRVIGIEQNPRRAEAVNNGENYISDVNGDELRQLVRDGMLSADTHFRRAGEMDVIVICVPTPLTRNLAPDLQYVVRVTEELVPHLRPGQLISLESTTYPGTTEEVILPILQRSGLVVDLDLFVAHSPERVDPGNARYTTKNTNKVVGGVGPHSLEVAQTFYRQTVEHIVPVSGTRAAEMVKVFENTFRAVNIALVNELSMLCDRMRLNVWEVLDAAFTKPFGIMPFYPGPGVGGHCIPIDPHYLEWKAKEYGFNTRFIALAGEINRRMPEFVKEKTLRLLSGIDKPLNRARVLALGAAYKKDLADYRESPAIEVIRLLSEQVHVDYHDPFVPEFTVSDRRFVSRPLTDELLEEADLVVILTDHSGIDYGRVVDCARLVFDTRNATKAIAAGREKVMLL